MQRCVCVCACVCVCVCVLKSRDTKHFMLCVGGLKLIIPPLPPPGPLTKMNLIYISFANGVGGGTWE